MRSDVNPLKVVQEQRGWTDQQVADLCAAAGHPTSASYINQIANGHRHPSRKFARALESALDGAVKAGDLLTWERPPAAAGGEAA
jgi:transcriptional regulator with XRE-family HTH domain